jgi:UDP-3-O-[3-hydroxymyristoyl] glucosamine N-acyltransferase
MAAYFSHIATFAREKLAAEVKFGPSDFEIVGVASKANWRPGRIAFAQILDDDLRATAQGFSDAALIIRKNTEGAVPDCPCLLVDNPRLVFAQIVDRFFLDKPAPGVHPTAMVDSSAKIHPDATVGPYCVIGARCIIGPRTVLKSHVVLAKDVKIGADCVLWSHAVVGEDGFGIERQLDANQMRLPHLGGVIIGDGVHVGNGATVAGGTIDPTMIGDGTMIDNLVHIAHNVLIGRNCQFAGGAQVAGSTVIGNNVTFAPTASALNKITIGDNVLIGLHSAVFRDVPSDVVAAGFPARVIQKKGSEP